MSFLPYPDRSSAGRVLAKHLAAEFRDSDVLVLGLARGGIPVAAEVARELGAPLDVAVVRKLGVPGQPELAMGAIAGDGVCVRNRFVIDSWHVTEAEFQQVKQQELVELERRERFYRGPYPPARLDRKAIIVVDDGLATGSSMEAALTALRLHTPAKLVVAVPVASPEAVERIRTLADEVVCPAMPHSFRAVGEFYEDFSQLTHSEVAVILADFQGTSRAATTG